MAQTDEEVKILENLLDIALAAVKRGDGKNAVKAMQDALDSANRFPKK